MQNERKDHWENVFSTKAPNEVSWFQEYPKKSVEFLELFDLPEDANIIDVGSGDSNFVDALLEKGYSNIYILDISENALERAKARLGEKANRVHWIVSDVRAFVPPVQFDFWHDRAAFHFLTDDESVNKYVHIAENGIRKGGYLVLGTFSEEGPQKCSGLDIQQYDPHTMSSRFEKEFDRIKCTRDEHVTPSAKTQQFLFCSFQKR